MVNDNVPYIIQYLAKYFSKKEEWDKAKISLDISEFRKAKDPMHAVAKGCLIAAQLIEKKRK